MTETTTETERLLADLADTDPRLDREYVRVSSVGDIEISETA